MIAAFLAPMSGSAAKVARGDCAKLERERPLTFLEFNDMILQAYDFLELSRRQNCVLQMGGSDQWGNIVNGIELGRRCSPPPPAPRWARRSMCW